VLNAAASINGVNVPGYELLVLNFRDFKEIFIDGKLSRTFLSLLARVSVNVDGQRHEMILCSRSEMTYWTLVDPHWNRVSIYDGPVVFLREFNSTPEPNRHLLAAHWCQSEVCNGGFDQFFYNPTGVLAPEAVQAFEAIGLSGVASIVRRAMSLLGPDYPRDQELRNEMLDALPDTAFPSLNEEFFRWIETENRGWEAAANEFAESHSG
jgi:hypothetical protein